ncbi:hypothetical protein GJAV_G00219110 [Gymnothorax javanicus]|nr:hypothetical protein GJAV_G00219110 [Gymnothorax javanicus]
MGSSWSPWTELKRRQLSASMETASDAILKKWPAATRGQIGTSINTKLTELRRSKKEKYFFCFSIHFLIFNLLFLFLFYLIVCVTI